MPLDTNPIREPLSNLPVDSKAKEEQRDYVSSAKRKRREANAKHWAFVMLVWIVVGCVGLAFFCKFWHLIMPIKYCWLDDAHLRSVEGFLTTGVLSGGVGAMFKSKLSDS